jgi:integrase
MIRVHVIARERDKNLSMVYRERPMFRIPPGTDKSGRGRLLPVTPDFSVFLDTFGERVGPVFTVPRRSDRTGGDAVKLASKLIADIGIASGVLTATNPPKHPTAHDLRRSFGARWSRKVMPQVLQLLMRHERIETTMKYYVGQDVQHAVSVLWD